MSKIQAVFERLQARGRKALIPFITAGDPAPELTVPLLHTLVQAGADIIELGVPFSDPMADGPTIQRASERALAKGVSLRHVLGMVANFRADDNETPIVLMGYANPIESMGLEAFAAASFDAGVDGVLVVDYPPEEAVEFAQTLHRHALDPIFLLAPTSSEARMTQVGALASGYIYYVSLKGVTGSAALDVAAVAARIPEIRARTGVPVGVGSASVMRRQRRQSRNWPMRSSSVAGSSKKSNSRRPTRCVSTSAPWWTPFAVRWMPRCREDKHELAQQTATAEDQA